MGRVSDIVIPCRVQDYSPHLMYTLRSIEANFPHQRVWLVGHKPDWVSDAVHFVPVKQGAVGYQNVLFNLLEVVSNDEVDSNFWYFNDDFYILKPVGDEPPVFHEGTLAERAKRLKGLSLGSYSSGALETYFMLLDAGFENPMNFDLHTPMPMDKLGIEDSIRLIQKRGKDFWPHLRSVYGAMVGLEGKPGKDYKVTSAGGSIPAAAIYASSSPRSMRGTFGLQLKRLFPHPCKYEKAFGL